MKRLLLTSVAALFLVTGTAHAQNGCYVLFCPITGPCRVVCPKEPKQPLDECDAYYGPSGSVLSPDWSPALKKCKEERAHKCETCF
jgi:hypothetical protein